MYSNIQNGIVWKYCEFDKTEMQNEEYIAERGSKFTESTSTKEDGRMLMILRISAFASLNFLLFSRNSLIIFLVWLQAALSTK